MASRPDRHDRHEWLDLLEVDGPFLSRPALDDVYDDAWPPRISSEQREILEMPEALSDEWDAAAMAQVDRLLTDVLGYQEGRTLKFDPGTAVHPVYPNAIVSPHAAVFSRRDPDSPRLVVLAGPAASETPATLDPEAITTHYGWPSTAVQRAALAARGFGADLALVTNGYQHLIVWVGSGITGYAWVDPRLYRLDRRLADAFVALLSAGTVTTSVDTSTADLLRLSQEKQADVTEKLGFQVRRAAEALVNAISRANRITDGKVLAGVASDEVYAGVVTVLMRTVFLLNAEERDLISSGDLWERAYSVSGLLDQLDDDHYRHQGVMRRRHGAWLRLLAAARAVHGGVAHSQMNVPAYGGALFDPVRHPFLEGLGVDGQILDVGVVDDATTRHVLDLLQRLNGQRLSYRTFSVEQIGQVYESLLDHSAVSVPEGQVVLGLVGAKGAEPEVDLADLEKQMSEGKLAEWLAANHDPSSGNSGKVAKWQGRIDRTPDEAVTATLAQACHGSAGTLPRVEHFASLVRTDARGVALVFLPGDVYVTETANRRDTGTAYTGPEFAAEIAHHALEHLVFEPGPHIEEDETKWKIKPPDEILALRVCDPAVGSGAILVAAVRYLADRLVESRLEHGELISSEIATAATDPTAADPSVQARRDVVSQCIYAVDRDSLAIEMAKLSLWLVTMARGRPFSFLDHAIKCGDSLLGVTSLDQLRRLHLGESTGTQIGLDLEGGRVEGLGGYFTMIDERINQALALRDLIREGDVKDTADAQDRAELNAKADRLLDDLRLVADAITAVCYLNAGAKSGSTEAALRDRVLPLAADLESAREHLSQLGSSRPSDAPQSLVFFHWAIEYPEVMRTGFDALIGNPPFQGGNKISGAMGSSYRYHLIRYCADNQSGSADLVAYFFRRASVVAKSFGFIATNSVAQGTTREVALDRLISSGAGCLARADSSVQWPGRDAVYVSRVWWVERCDRPLVGVVLDGKPVRGIASDLWPSGRVTGFPRRIPSHSSAAAQGQLVLGKGFILSEAEASELLAADPSYGEVVFPFISGSDLNNGPSQQTDRWAINFHDWPVDKAEKYEAPFELILERVKPERDKNTRKTRREKWWRYGEYRPSLVARLSRIDRCIAVAQTSQYVVPAWVATDAVLSHGLVVFPWDDEVLYGVLTSTIHRLWIDRYSSTLETRLRYSPSDCFDTLPLPGVLSVSTDPTHDALRAGAGSSPENLAAVGCLMTLLHEWRAERLNESNVGLTELYHDYHLQIERGATVRGLRERHVELDGAVRDAYGWGDLDLDHGFHDTRHGRFFTVSTEARFELLMRLLELNFQQAADQTGRSVDAVMKEAQQHV